MAEHNVCCLNFFDTENPAVPISVPEKTKVPFQVGDEKYSGEIQKRDHSYQVIMTDDGEYNKVHDQIGEHGLWAEIRPIEFKINCTRYITSSVFFHLKRDSGTCCCVQVPTSQESEGCLIHFGAWRRDADKKMIAMEKEVIWNVKEIQTKAPVAASGKGKTGQSSTPFTATVTTVNGIAELFNLPLERLYQFEVQAPEGWRCPEPVFYQYVCCDTTLEIVRNFEPCDCKPTRTLIFVEKGCQGVRWSPSVHGAEVSMGGRPIKIDKGMANVPSDIKGGALAFNYPGTAFDPPLVEFTDDGPAVATITVSQQPSIKTPRLVQGQLIAEDKTPFVRRKIYCKLPNQQDVRLLETDEHGCFTCEEGSLVHAEEDEHGLAIAPFLLTEI